MYPLFLWFQILTYLNLKRGLENSIFAKKNFEDNSTKCENKLPIHLDQRSSSLKVYSGQQQKSHIHT